MCIQSRQPPGRPVRAAFTLIELLVSIIIISILMAMLLPAIGSVRRAAQIAQAQNDIKQLENALADFKNKFGVYPPSGITLYEEAADWDANPADAAVIRQIWPQFDFSQDRDLNEDTDMTDDIELTGAECLVFFLGGIVVGNEDENHNGVLDGGEDDNLNDILDLGVPTGFSANPADPFAAGGTNRVGPFHNFLANRIVFDGDTDGFNVYVDTLPSQTAPYIYLSAYDGSGYKTADLPANTLTVDVYRQNSSGTNPPAWNPKTLQIISPGFDGPQHAPPTYNAYGEGGVYNPATVEQDFVGNRDPERDNLTNFHTGELAP